MDADFQPPSAFFEFRVVRKLGSGAMGEVFLADDELLGRQVAIKFVRSAHRPEARARFLLEARALARLQHPNVVTVHRVGEIAGRPFIVSEWVSGRSLAEWPLPLEPGLALRVALQLARALAAAHRAGVLHRDLKPANVLLSDGHELKLVDFGVAATLDEPREPPPDGAPRAQDAQARDARTNGAPTSDAPKIEAPTSEASRSDAQSRAAAGLGETQPLPGAPANAGTANAATANEALTNEARPPAARLEVGTPLYAAPELLRGEPGTRLTDLYAWGAVMYELCSGAPPYDVRTLDALRARAEKGDAPPLAQGGPLAALVRACLSPNPRGRPQRAEALLEVLEPLLAREQGPLPEEPYRGLSVFGPEHAQLFFGREREVRAVLERLRAETFVVVAGDSGVGKSSLCRAGILPQLAAGALGLRRHEVIALSLGARPVEALAIALRPWLGLAEDEAATALRSAPEQLAARLRAPRDERARALFIDGLEELVSMAAPEDRESAARFLGALAVRAPSFRLLATARSDFLTRLAALPALGPELAAALYLLQPLSNEGLLQAIEGPLRAAGFRFEPPELVEELLAAANAGPGGLPLVQFALAELWRLRDPARRVIRRESLVALGGVGGALARHADEAIAQLSPAQRKAAAQLLRRLVTAQGTRARRRREEFAEDESTSQALQALVAARILIVSDAEAGAQTWELAHEALIQSWAQLRAWLGEDERQRALAQRVEQAAEEWERSGGEGLWSPKRLRELRAFPELALGERERRFLLASSRASLRRRVSLAALSIAVPLAVALAVIVPRERSQAAIRAAAEAKLAVARAAFAQAESLDAEERSARAAAFARFDADEGAPAEAAWAQVRARKARLQAKLDEARAALPQSDGGRALLAKILALQLAREEGNPLSRERESLLGQLAPLDPSGKLRAPFVQPARVRVDVGAALVSGEQRLPLAAGEEREVPPGAYVIERDGDVRLPILLRFGARESLRLASIPPAPTGFVRIPAGRFLTGFDGDEDVRIGFFNAPPLHERASQSFAIARTEVTFGAWLRYLRALPAQERAQRTPHAGNALSLVERNGKYLLRIRPTVQQYEALEGSPLVYPGRHRNAAVDWLQLPVTGVTFEDALAYARWLGQSLRGARLCTETEWERAARGADGRAFPGGDALAGDDADIDETYGREPLAFGPDPAGLHPRSRSPVGADDLAGNAWELTVSQSGAPVLRGGSWYQGSLTARSVNREPTEPTARGLLAGLRLCMGEQ